MTKDQIKVSITIPYYRREENLRLVLSALARQGVPRSEFEVVIGAMEHSESYVALCKKFEEDVQIVSVMSSDPWQISKARNMAMRQARGDVVVAMDADILLPRNFVRDIYRNFSWGEKQCILGQMIDYDNNTRDVDHVDVAPFESYLSRLKELEAKGPGRADMRFGQPHVIPWAYAWTALIAIPRRLMEEHDLYFNEGYFGYGVEDLEWASRIMDQGYPIRLSEEIWGIHLPHPRSLSANQVTEAVNYCRFLSMRPEKTVELACAFGDFEANHLYPKLTARIAEVCPDGARTLGSSLLSTGEGDVLVLGVGLDDTGAPAVPEEIDVVPGARLQRCSELLGMRLPYEGGSISRIIVLPSATALGEPFAGQVAKEAERLSASVEHAR